MGRAIVVVFARIGDDDSGDDGDDGDDHSREWLSA